jgi:hypothetical protein
VRPGCRRRRRLRTLRLVLLRSVLRLLLSVLGRCLLRRRGRRVLLRRILRRWLLGTRGLGRVLRLRRRWLSGRWPGVRDRYWSAVSCRGLLPLPWLLRFRRDLHKRRWPRGRKSRRLLRLFGAERAICFRGRNIASALRTYPAEHWLFPLYTSRHTRAVSSHSRRMYYNGTVGTGVSFSRRAKSGSGRPVSRNVESSHGCARRYSPGGGLPGGRSDLAFAQGLSS